jgi:hypothetical protein
VTPPAARIRVLLVIVLALAAGVVTLRQVSPERPGRYPFCLLFRLTGLHCPGCGTLRGLHCLLNGEVRQAFAYNPIAPVLAPAAAAFGLWCAARYLRGQPLPRLRVSRAAGWALVAALALFGVARNLPAEPFPRLAPHRLDVPDATPP